MQQRTPSLRMRARRAAGALPLALRSALALALALIAITPAAWALGEGDRAPAFNLPSLDGRGQVSLEQYKGKVVWLDFWASWCPPCLTSVPEIEALRKEMPASKFQIVAINIDEQPDKARRFLQKQPVGYPSASDPNGELPEIFGLETMPTSYLIDQKGVIRMVHKGYRAGDIEKIKAEATKLMRKSR